jgi:cell wall-associated NlpC family hydrolase
MSAHIPTHDGTRSARRLAIWLALAMLVAPATATADSGGAGIPPSPPVQPAPVSGAVAKLSPDGRTAMPPAAAPEPLKEAIYAANEITSKPYVYGGGHDRFRSRGYDCSGAVSYALHGAGVLDEPLASGDLSSWGESGKGTWITVYTNADHAYAVIAGLRFDTSGRGESGPRWRTASRSSKGFKARHPEGM